MIVTDKGSGPECTIFGIINKTEFWFNFFLACAKYFSSDTDVTVSVHNRSTSPLQYNAASSMLAVLVEGEQEESVRSEEGDYHEEAQEVRGEIQRSRFRYLNLFKHQFTV